MIASQLPGYCDVINKRLWRHEQNVNPAREARRRCVYIVVFIVILSSLCRVRNKMMYVLSWRTVSALNRVLFLSLFPSLLRNSGNKHQNYPLVSAETVRHSSTYISLYIPQNVLTVLLILLILLDSCDIFTRIRRCCWDGYDYHSASEVTLINMDTIDRFPNMPRREPCPYFQRCNTWRDIRINSADGWKKHMTWHPFC